MNKEDTYREFVKQSAHFIDNSIWILTSDEHKHIHHHVWLLLMGLMETWDMI